MPFPLTLRPLSDMTLCRIALLFFSAAYSVMKVIKSRKRMMNDSRLQLRCRAGQWSSASNLGLHVVIHRLPRP